MEVNASAMQGARLLGLIAISDHWIYFIGYFTGTEHHLQRYILFLEVNVLESGHREGKCQEQESAAHKRSSPFKHCFRITLTKRFESAAGFKITLTSRFWVCSWLCGVPRERHIFRDHCSMTDQCCCMCVTLLDSQVHSMAQYRCSTHHPCASIRRGSASKVQKERRCCVEQPLFKQ